MFLEALQSYYAPIVTLLIFIGFIISNHILSKKVKTLFLIESGVIFLIIIATWFDRCLSVQYLNGTAWKWRLHTTFINFAFSPFSPAILVHIYRKKESKKKNILFYIPAILNCLICTASVWTGWIFSISSENQYIRGPLFILPFAVSAYYFLSLIIFSSKQLTPNKQIETILLSVIMAAIGIASVLEVVLVVRFMIWSTTEICVIIYFMLLNIQQIMYDNLTGTFSRVAYAKRLERINHKEDCCIAMIDLNNLKYFNDTYGHCTGDKAICEVTKSILENKYRGMRLYRYGGDEFVLIDKKGARYDMKEVLQHALKDCGVVSGTKVTFAYGIVLYNKEQELQKVLALADEKMYHKKHKMKEQEF